MTPAFCCLIFRVMAFGVVLWQQTVWAGRQALGHSSAAALGREPLTRGGLDRSACYQCTETLLWYFECTLAVLPTQRHQPNKQGAVVGSMRHLRRLAGSRHSRRMPGAASSKPCCLRPSALLWCTGSVAVHCATRRTDSRSAAF